MIVGTMPPRRVEERKVTVCGKVSPATADALERLRQQMEADASPATITTSQLVGHAVVEFLERHSGKQPKPRQK